MNSMIKSTLAILREFLRQYTIRPFANNISMLINNLRMVFADDKEPFYGKKHSLNRTLLKGLIGLPYTEEEALPVEKYRIWVLWWQGEKQMPEIVRCAYNSICNNSPKEVVLITKDNWTEYISPDEWIVEKVHEGKMKLPALSDYIRASLLYSYGGMWIDSTVLCTTVLPDYIFECDFFTVHDLHPKTEKYVAKGRWNVQILGTNKRHLAVFRGIRHIFSEYWRRYDYIMDYLLVDYSIDYIYNENKKMRALIDNVPETNTNMHKLLDLCNKPYDEAASDWKLMQKDTWFFKLTYKRKFVEECDGRKTVYKYIIEKTRWRN